MQSHYVYSSYIYRCIGSTMACQSLSALARGCQSRAGTRQHVHVACPAFLRSNSSLSSRHTTVALDFVLAVQSGQTWKQPGNASLDTGSCHPRILRPRPVPAPQKTYASPEPSLRTRQDLQSSALPSNRCVWSAPAHRSAACCSPPSRVLHPAFAFSQSRSTFSVRRLDCSGIEPSCPSSMPGRSIPDRHSPSDAGCESDTSRCYMHAAWQQRHQHIGGRSRTAKSWSCLGRRVAWAATSS